MSSSHYSLSSATDERKARLAKLKTLKRKQPADEGAPPESARSPSPPQEPDVSRLHVSGRNYDHETRGPKLGFEAPPTLDLEKPTLEEQAAKVESEVKKQAEDDEKEDQGVDLFKLQPKKPNWDLKRDLDKKMTILNTRTDNAIARLVRARITGAQKPSANAGEASANGQVDLDAAGMDGTALVEGLRVREQEEEEEERREREEDDALAA